MAPPDLSAHKNVHRVIAIVAPSPTDARAARQRTLLDRDLKGCTERDLVVVTLPGETFTILLVGKDGGEKKRWTAPVSVKEIFALIDAMPMRMAEMREKKRAGQQ